MTRCKKCKAIISVGFEDIDKNGEMPMPEKQSRPGSKVCKECEGEPKYIKL